MKFVRVNVESQDVAVYTLEPNVPGDDFTISARKSGVELDGYIQLSTVEDSDAFFFVWKRAGLQHQLLREGKALMDDEKIDKLMQSIQTVGNALVGGVMSGIKEALIKKPERTTP